MNSRRELHSVPSQGRIAEYRIGEAQSGGVGAQPEAGYTSPTEATDHLRYDECIGAKKHLVTGVSPHTGSGLPEGSFTIG